MANTLKGKKIVLGITGSIAAYKACYIIRGLIKQGAEVQVVITPAGKEFITPITLSALTSKPVISEFFAQRDGTWNSHVDLGLWADAMLIAPATASTIGKMANGVADNMLITTYLSAKAPVFVAPAMDLDMYAHPSTQANLDTLRSYGNHIIEPGTGFLASHLEGKGRMEEPENIIFVASPDHPCTKKSPLTLNKIISEPFILTEKDASYRFILDQYLAAYGQEIHPRVESSSTDFIIQLLLKNEFLSFVPQFAVQNQIAQGILTPIPVSDFDLHIWRQIVYHKDKLLTLEMKAFFQLVQ
mgnify:CR=1 FL=1